jgi:catechol 2,3-dioxygenase-like lactoylglutathione lyase family enzyme
MDYDKISAPDFGRSLSGLGLNLLVRDVPKLVAFLVEVFGMTAHQASRDFAILRYGTQVFQLHSDPTFANHPLAALLPEAGPRGAGIELRLYETDPDAAVAAAAAHAHEATILQDPANKPHGLREAVILCENGYAWVPARALTAEEEADLT